MVDQERGPIAPEARTLPVEISTGCAELDLAWRAYAPGILDRLGTLVPDTEEDLNWRGFLGGSVFMDNFRAAEFVGVTPLTRRTPSFVSLRQRGLGVAELSAIWRDVGSILWLAKTRTPVRRIVEILQTDGGLAGQSLAEALEHFPHRKSVLDIQGLLWNANKLKNHGHSFRRWLEARCADLGVSDFPPVDFRQPVTVIVRYQSVAVLEERMPLEWALRSLLQLRFYYVGPEMSARVIGDWMLWLWRAKRAEVFAAFEFNAIHEAFLKRFGNGVVPVEEIGFARWWLDIFPEIPPRLASECIRLAVEENLIDMR